MATTIITCGVTTTATTGLPKSHNFEPFSSSATNSTLSLPTLTTVNGRFSAANRRYLTSGSPLSLCHTRSKMEFVVYAGDQVGDLLPLGIHLPDSWPAWIPGFLFAVIVPFFTNKWGPFAKFKEELDKVEVAVDSVADRVEEIAEKVENFVDDIADDLPEGSALRQTLEKVESVADRIGKDAHMMDEMEAKVENMFNKTSEGNGPPKTSDVNAKVKPPQSTNL
ncbi:hypothetical protein Ccrd_023256 [Cynara cardunculus var. scolymus]|uniref:Uncharacterized protein n=1 Tax=Cynara cardunculus var. scolymus TaxID=59895 RepID=A0A103XX74_CYNCS|nr:hypothetical protein Ccrd_023256 [Cynara cardunculus var. scolymus]